MILHFAIFYQWDTGYLFLIHVFHTCIWCVTWKFFLIIVFDESHDTYFWNAFLIPDFVKPHDTWYCNFFLISTKIHVPHTYFSWAKLHLFLLFVFDEPRDLCFLYLFWLTTWFCFPYFFSMSHTIVCFGDFLFKMRNRILLILAFGYTFWRVTRYSFLILVFYAPRYASICYLFLLCHKIFISDTSFFDEPHDKYFWYVHPMGNTGKLFRCLFMRIHIIFASKYCC